MFWTGPVFATKAVFEKIRPHFNPKHTVIGTIFAQGLIHLLAHRVFGSGVGVFALRDIPWICRTTTNYEESEIFGEKASIDVIIENLDAKWVKN